MPLILIVHACASTALTTPNVLVSVRYGESQVFKHLAESIDTNLSNDSSVDIFIELIEAIVKAAADGNKKLPVYFRQAVFCCLPHIRPYGACF